jgi:hypothetical protein
MKTTLQLTLSIMLLLTSLSTRATNGMPEIAEGTAALSDEFCSRDKSGKIVESVVKTAMVPMVGYAALSLVMSPALLTLPILVPFMAYKALSGRKERLSRIDHLTINSCDEFVGEEQELISNPQTPADIKRNVCIVLAHHFYRWYQADGINQHSDLTLLEDDVVRWFQANYQHAVITNLFEGAKMLPTHHNKKDMIDLEEVLHEYGMPVCYSDQEIKQVFHHRPTVREIVEITTKNIMDNLQISDEYVQTSSFSSDCGSSSDIEESVKSCNYQRTPYGLYMWQLAHRKDGRESWLHNNLLWHIPNSNKMDYQDSTTLCNQLSSESYLARTNWRLAEASEFKQASRAKIHLGLPGIATNRSFWAKRYHGGIGMVFPYFRGGTRSKGEYTYASHLKDEVESDESQMHTLCVSEL